MKGHQYLHNGATPFWSDAFSFSYIDEWALEKQQKNKSAWETMKMILILEIVNAKNIYMSWLLVVMNLPLA